MPWNLQSRMKSAPVRPAIRTAALSLRLERSGAQDPPRPRPPRSPGARLARV